jgi:hypothetical protein
VLEDLHRQHQVDRVVGYGQVGGVAEQAGESGRPPVAGELLVRQVDADDRRVREALADALRHMTLADPDLEDASRREPLQHGVQCRHEALHHPPLERVRRAVLVVRVARRDRGRHVAALPQMRATERQRGSGQQLRRQYAVWPGNAVDVVMWPPCGRCE